MNARTLLQPVSRLLPFLVLLVSLLTGFAADKAPAPARPSKEAREGGEPKDGTGSFDKLRVGDTILILYSDIPNPPPASTEQIREDGKIGLHLNYEILAAGKSRGELEKEIRRLYVEEKQVYKDIKISVQATVRYVSVGGEVRVPGNVAHPGELTVLKAINASGGFTDYANKKAVVVIRASDGKTVKVNCKAAIDDPSKDQPVYPGDRIHVKKSIW